MNGKFERSQVSSSSSPTEWTSIRLTFARQDRDVPELAIVGWPVSEAERQELQHELNRSYRGLLSNVKNGRDQYRFQTSIQGVPPDADFRATLVVDKSNPRTDGLVFSPVIAPEPISPAMLNEHTSLAATDKPLETAGHWSGAFMTEATGFLSPTRIRSLKDRYQSHALQAVVEELEALQQSQPEAFATLLFAGYLSLGESLARRHDPDRGSLYHFANRGFEELLESSAERRETPTDEDSGLRDLIPFACRCIARLFGFGAEAKPSVR